MSTHRIRYFQFSLSSLFIFITLSALLVRWYANYPQVALDGNCPVTLCERHAWCRGNAKFAVNYEGIQYFCANQYERSEFLKSPEKYAVAFQGYDPVILIDKQQRFSGDRRYGVFYNGRVIVFSGEISLRRFEQSPGKYFKQALQVFER